MTKQKKKKHFFLLPPNWYGNAFQRHLQKAIILFVCGSDISEDSLEYILTLVEQQEKKKKIKNKIKPMH